ncbi:hypothetical protein ABT288_13785 [Streptomyces sp. NPDC001093]|uniref:hypothetical protein n=1 Tax=Streptomyces sp. NPDC001093 TaxID=3154376 RepID=UPI0033241180
MDLIDRDGSEEGAHHWAAPAPAGTLKLRAMVRRRGVTDPKCFQAATVNNGRMGFRTSAATEIIP